MIDLIEPHQGTQVLGHIEYIRSFAFRHKCSASTGYVSLIGLQNHALRVSGVLARFRDIDFNGYRHCVNPNTPIEAIRNPARQHQSRDVKVGDNPTARTLSFGKEIEEHAIQQGSARVNTGMQQDIGELAAHSCPLERKGNQGHWSEGNRHTQSQCLVMEQSLGDIRRNAAGNPQKTSYGNGECGAAFLAKGPQKCWDSGGHWQRGREFGGAPFQTPPNPTDLVESGGASNLTPPSQKRKQNLATVMGNYN
ncbi:hypothetical protein R3P38DRAFT_2815977 [Favolaschia claudopus]|uniref:Uncharacterized protein n=1 Tax=Favolaschia claudopus TaxID=2862362 RepID=A0AAV9YZZ4_9AGAR